MPHHPVPMPKEMPPVVDRLRLALIHTMRRTIIEAVDKVWITFEDELAQLTSPSVESSVDEFEQFSNCCNRLTRFINNNMETTPGFLAQMDRLILACHSGATGPALNSVITKELRIRRDGNQKNGKQRVTVSGETDTTSSIDEPRVIPPSSDTTEQEKSSDSEIESTGTVGTPSRQWTSRKRLSTRMARQPRTKRVKRSLMVRDEELLRQEEETKSKGENAPRKEKKEKKKLRTRSLMKQVKESTRHSRRSSRGRQPRQSSGAEQKKPRARRSERVAKQGESRKTETERKLRWNLRSVSNESCANGANEICQTQSKAKQGEKPVELEESISMAKCTAICEEGPHEEDTTKDGEQGNFRVDEPAQLLESLFTVGITRANDGDIKAGGVEGIAALEREIEMALASNGVYLVDNEEMEEEGSIESTKTLHSNPEAVILDGRYVTENISSAENDGLGGPSAVRGLSPGVIIDHDEQVILDDSGVDCGAFKNYNDLVAFQLPNAGDALNVDTSAEHQQPKPTTIESYMLETDFVESEEESAVPGLCDAGMRTASQISHFKGCLRKSIRLVDAMLCQPPPGKKCSRGCDKIRARQCREGVPCRDSLCKNWHDTEAHTELCTNDLCEFKNRIVLRETMNQIANLNEETKLLMSQWEENLMEYTVATVDGTNDQYTPAQLQQLHDDIERLFRRISSSKKEIESLESKQRLLCAYLSAIGITSQTDAADNFPDFETHYQ